MTEYDLVIIGSGWAGFNAALRAKEFGLKVCLLEKSQIGGVCLNLGCIPTKTLIQAAKVFNLTRKSTNFGIESVNPQINWSKIQERKDKIIQQLRLGMQLMLKGIDFFPAEAEVLSNQEIRSGDKILKTKFILLAVGSKPLELPNLKFDGKKIVSSDEIINLKEIPKSLLIIGGGVIGCEFASLFSMFGSRVSIVEKMPQLLPGEDAEVARRLQAIFKKRGINVSTNTDATNLDIKNYDLVLLSIGRVSQAPQIQVDEYLRTKIPNIYAAGDCTKKIMLAHFAAYQGRIAAENIAHPQNPKKADNPHIPNCIFTLPEIASVGLSEEKAKTMGLEIKIKKFDFMASGMAHILDETEGFIKIVSDGKTGEIKGASIIGPYATELIGILTLAITQHLTLSSLKDTLFAHPTLSESIIEALKD
ncbi:MAG: dihydrolipoyl dehydrogenase [Candidatus Omnitrophica bacterium]|nr:dihydrolipoyl dehydrogenase [Candidatus Omnitrophota bacterium]